MQAKEEITDKKDAILQNVSSSGFKIKTEPDQSSQEQQWVKVKSAIVCGEKIPCDCDECIGKQFIKEDCRNDDENGNQSSSNLKNELAKFVATPRRSLRVASSITRVSYIPPRESDFDDSDDDNVNERNETQNISEPEEESDDSISTESEKNGEVADDDTDATQSESEDEASSDEMDDDDDLLALNSGRKSIKTNASRKGKRARMIVLRWDCPIEGCSEKTNEKEPLLTHLKESHKVNRFRCFVAGCEASFSNRESFKAHRQKHRRFKCFKCKQPFSDYFKLRDHFYKYHHYGSLFGCSKCDFVNDCFLKAVSHIRKHKSFKCTFVGCERVFYEQCHLKLHLKHHSKKAFLFQCFVCKGGFPTKPELIAHKCPDILYRCKWPGCGHTARFNVAMGSHIRSKHFHLPSTVKTQKKMGIVDNRDYKPFMERVGPNGVPLKRKGQLSRFCSDGTLEEADFSPPATPEHVPNLLGDDENEETQDRQEYETDEEDNDSENESTKKKCQQKYDLIKVLSLNCNLCDTTHPNKKELYKHQFKKHQLNELRCYVKGCNASFADNRYDLHYHLKKKHGKVRNWLCPQCPSKFCSHVVLATHVRGKHLTGTFQCTFANCGLTFDTKHDAHRHQLTHYQFICPVKGCRKISHSKSKHNEHMRNIHTNDRPFKCADCDKTFKTKSHLYAHRLQHHTRRNRYRCTWPDCSYEHKTRHQVVYHIKYAHLHLIHASKRRKDVPIHDQDPWQYVADIV